MARIQASIWSSDGLGTYTIAPIDTADAPPRGTRVVLHLLEDATSFTERYHDAYLRETRVFLDVIAGRAENPSPPREALVSLRLAEACEESLRIGKPVEVGA